MALLTRASGRCGCCSRAPEIPVERYLELALRFGRLAPGLVEAHAVSPELAARIEAEPEPVALALLEQASSLYAGVGDDAELEPDRRTWLSAQLAGIVTAIEQLAGETRSYFQLVQRCHGVRTALAPEEQFAAAHRRLDDALPGHGDVPERYQAWALTQRVPEQLLLPGLIRLADELGRRTRERFDLPGGDGVTFEIVTGKRWAGNAAFLGGGHTRIGINRDLPIASFRLVELVVHEAFPGHHTEAVCKERLGGPSWTSSFTRHRRR